MRTRIVLLSVLWLVLLAPRGLAENVIVDHRCVDADDSVIPQEVLDKARQLNVLFGHQSVGGNIIDGIHALAGRNAERYHLEFVSDPPLEWFDENRGWGEFSAGENEDPKSKADHFRRKLEREGFGKKLDVALVKYCYVDLPAEGCQPKAVFEQYRAAMEAVEKACPKLRVVWCTAPLEEENNGARNEFNRLVREHCTAKNKVLFDLAAIESHDASGKATEPPALRKEYSEDGGHLNEAGQLKAARAWWWLMARLAGWDGKPA